VPRVSQTIRFDAGIEQITQRGDAAPEALPDRAGALIPGAARYSQQITELLFPPSIEQSLLESFRPELENRAILNPVEYQAALQTCRDELERLVNDRAGGPAAEKLQRAVDELQSDFELFRLLTTKRPRRNNFYNLSLSVAKGCSSNRRGIHGV
jgi:Type III secretion system YscX (type_III_YscX)